MCHVHAWSKPAEPRFLFSACLPILKYGNNSWDLAGWFPKCASRCARGSMRKILRKHDARGSSFGSSWRPYVRLEMLFAEASRKHLPRNNCGRVCGSKIFFEVRNESSRKLRGSSRVEGLLFPKKSIRNKNHRSAGIMYLNPPKNAHSPKMIMETHGL